MEVRVRELLLNHSYIDRFVAHLTVPVVDNQVTTHTTDTMERFSRGEVDVYLYLFGSISNQFKIEIGVNKS